jgi:hypothetical protein
VTEPKQRTSPRDYHFMCFHVLHNSGLIFSQWVLEGKVEILVRVSFPSIITFIESALSPTSEAIFRTVCSLMFRREGRLWFAGGFAFAGRDANECSSLAARQ